MAQKKDKCIFINKSAIDNTRNSDTFTKCFGAGCSKVMTSLVNVSLIFQTLISEIYQYFMLKTCEKLLHCKSFSHFSTKNSSVFSNKVVKHLMKLHNVS